MPFYAVFNIDNADVEAATASRESTSPDAALESFHTDIFRNPHNTYPDWDEVILEFNLSAEPPTLTLSRPGDKAGTTLELVVKDGTAESSSTEIKISSSELEKLRAAAPLQTLKLSVKDLKQLSREHPIVQAIGNTISTGFYRRLSNWYLEYYMHSQDRANLVHYTGQRGTAFYLSRFVETGESADGTQLVTIPQEDHLINRSITLGDNPNEYLIINELRLSLEDFTPGKPKVEYCTLISHSHYDRTTGKLIGPLEITAVFPDGLSYNEVERRIERLTQAYTRINSDTAKYDSYNPGDLNVIKILNKTPRARPAATAAAALAGILFIAGVICITLIALNLLPALPFLAGLSLKLGGLVLSGPPLSALVAGLATLVATVAAATFSFVNFSSVKSNDFVTTEYKSNITTASLTQSAKNSLYGKRGYSYGSTSAPGLLHGPVGIRTSGRAEHGPDLSTGLPPAGDQITDPPQPGTT